MFVKVITRPGLETYGGLCPEALVLPDSFGVDVGGGVCWLGHVGPLSLFAFLSIRLVPKQEIAEIFRRF